MPDAAETETTTVCEVPKRRCNPGWIPAIRSCICLGEAEVVRLERGLEHLGVHVGRAGEEIPAERSHAASTWALVMSWTPRSLPIAEQRRALVGVDGPHRVGHQGEPDVGAMGQQALDGVAVADVERHAVEDDARRRQRAQDRQHVGIGEDVEPVLEEEDVAVVAAGPGADRRGVQRLGLDPERMVEHGFGNLLLARRAPHAMVGEGGLPVGRGGELAVPGHVVVAARDDADAMGVGELGEPAQHRDDALAVRDVEPPVRPHEVDLGVDVPEDQITAHSALRSIDDCDLAIERLNAGSEAIAKSPIVNR